MTLLWIDLETTGLSPTKDFILEVAWCITTETLANGGIPVDSYVVATGDNVFHRIAENEVVHAMHTKSGLLEVLLEPGTLPLQDIEKKIIRDIGNYDGPVYLAGSSVHFDLLFVQEHMPELAKHLSHRLYDVRTLQFFFDQFLVIPEVVNTAPHRAGTDILASLTKARQYQEVMHGAAEMVDLLRTHEEDKREFEKVVDTLEKMIRLTVQEQGK